MTVHAEKRVIPHRPEELYALVADVRRYPEFLPWCMAARIREESDAALAADLIIGFQMFREVVSGSGAIGTVNHIDRLVGTTEFAVVLNLSEKDAR